MRRGQSNGKTNLVSNATWNNQYINISLCSLAIDATTDGWHL